MQIYIKRSKLMLYIIFGMMMTDYILTYIGINTLSCIAEANPLMNNMFCYSFKDGLLIRALQSSIPVGILYFAIQKNYKIIYYKLLVMILILEVCVIFMHIIWLSKYYIFFY